MVSSEQAEKQRIPLADIIKECDKLFNSNRSAELGAFLRAWRAKAQEIADRAGELSILNELIGHYRMTKDELHGLQAVNDAVKLIGDIGMERDLSAGTIYLNAATALSSFDKFEEALQLYSKAQTCYVEHLEEEDVRFAGLYNNMAAAVLATGNFSSAEEYYFKAVDILSAASSLMDLAVTYVNIAQLYYTRDAEDVMVSSSLDCAMLCFNDPAAAHDGYYAHTCSKCAGAFGDMGRKDDEEELLTRARRYYAGNQSI